MSAGINPFTYTSGCAGSAYINSGIADEIINDMTDPESLNHTYKITGLHGSGKSVEYEKVVHTLEKKDKWFVCSISASDNIFPVLVAKFDKFLKRKTDNINRPFDENTLEELIKLVNRQDYNILIGIDDVSKSFQIIRLISVIHAMQLTGYKIYLLIAGLSENIRKLSNENELIFLDKANEFKTKWLNYFDISFNYQRLLKITPEESAKLAKLTKGYAYAYQVLGHIYFANGDCANLDDLMPEFDRSIFRNSYEYIWKDLTEGEKNLVRYILRTKDGKADEIKKFMSNKNSYPVLRARLLNKCIVTSERRGYLTIRLPRFDEYVHLWCE